MYTYCEGGKEIDHKVEGSSQPAVTMSLQLSIDPAGEDRCPFGIPTCNQLGLDDIPHKPNGGIHQPQNMTLSKVKVVKVGGQFSLYSRCYKQIPNKQQRIYWSFWLEHTALCIYQSNLTKITFFSAPGTISMFDDRSQPMIHITRCPSPVAQLRSADHGRAPAR